MANNHLSKLSMMPAPFSEDLRLQLNMVCPCSSEFSCRGFIFTGRFFSERTVQRYISKFLVTGDVKSAKIGRSYGSIHFAPREELIICEAVLSNPDKTLAEIAEDIYQQTNSIFAPSTLH